MTTLSASGGLTPYAWSVASGSLPAGLSLDRTGTLSGTPTTAGAFMFTAVVVDSEQPASLANGPLSITVNPGLQVTTTSLPSGGSGISYSATLAATGGIAPYTWSISHGSLPGGLTLNATSGLISGTPTGAGASSFTVQASDSETPAGTATAALSIVINPPPPRSAALYTGVNPPSLLFDVNQAGLQIQNNGSLTLLPSSPETANAGLFFAASPTLPLLFFVPANGILSSPPEVLQSLGVNPDYSLSAYGSSPSLPVGTQPTEIPSVDPTGSNLYLPGYIDNSSAAGVNIFTANGSPQPVGTIAIPDVANGFGRMVFTPDGTLSFLSVCSTSPGILSFSRGTNGMLTPAGSQSAASCPVFPGMAVSPDGKYLATPEVQIYSIASNGALTPVLSQPFTVTGGGVNLTVNDITWDSSGSFLLVGTSNAYLGGIGVLSFSGSALTETVTPTGGPVGRLQQTGSFVYGMGLCNGHCNLTSIFGYDFQNGQLTPLPGSPYPYGNTGDMVIY